jgi:uncharacterized protein YigE (DUF2233 family)
VTVVLLLLVHLPAHADPWKPLAPGLKLGTFSLASHDGSPTISLLRIDPDRFCFRLIAQNSSLTQVATLEQWCQKKHLVAAINASMYREDRQQSTGYMKTGGLVNNGYINPRFGAFFVFDPKVGSLPKVTILDRKHDDWRFLITRYDTVIQNFRLISSTGKNLWPPSNKKHSIAAIGMTTGGRVLFIHCKTPMSVHAFNQALLHLPVNLKTAMYVEGGPEAAMHLHLPHKRRSWMGQYEHPLLGTIHEGLWPIPNIIGIAPVRACQQAVETNATGE